MTDILSKFRRLANLSLETDSCFLSNESVFLFLQMMGCLLLSSLFEVLVGATGMVGYLLRYIGPLTISTVVTLIGLSLYKIPMEYARTHWGVTAV